MVQHTAAKERRVLPCWQNWEVSVQSCSDSLSCCTYSSASLSTCLAQAVQSLSTRKRRAPQVKRKTRGMLKSKAGLMQCSTFVTGGLTGSSITFICSFSQTITSLLAQVRKKHLPKSQNNHFGRISTIITNCNRGSTSALVCATWHKLMCEHTNMSS